MSIPRAAAWLALASTMWLGAPARGQSTDTTARVAAGQTLSDSALEARTAAVAAKLRCPVCQGESIQDSPSSLAREMRSVVKERVRAGETPEQIEAYFVGRYGEWILLEPTTTGLNLLLYILPVVLVVGGVALVVVLVRRWSAAAPAASPPGESP